MQKWVEIRKSGQFDEIGRIHNIPVEVARLLVNRGVKEPEAIERYLNASLKELYSPLLLKDAQKAADIILDRIKSKKHIRIIGDYDIDGICASYILEKTLKNCYMDIHGESDDGLIDTVLPHRIEDGYGMNIKLIDQAAADGVELIVTCDNGISASKEVEYGNRLGVEFIITDHHEVPYHEENDKKIYEVPDALAVVNPKQADCTYPFENICGAVVAFKLCGILYEMTGDRDKMEFLDMAAFATIGDVMPLCDENRILVKYGLDRIKNTKNIGMRALIKLAGLDAADSITVFHVGFVLGPNINAAGRLESAILSRNLLMAENEEEAMEIAEHLLEINQERKDETEKGVKKAQEYIDSLEEIPDVLVVYLNDCHESIAGIVAGRLRERYNHPAIVLTAAIDGVKGSGRSIEEYDMHANLLKVRDMFSKFGGHPMAAGLSMSAGNEAERIECVKKLQKSLNDNSALTEEDFYEKVSIDMVLPFNRINEELIEKLSVLEPCGMGNKTPLFGAKNVQIKNAKLVGKNEDILKGIAVDETGRALDLIYFKQGREMLEYIEGKENVLLAFSLAINEFRGVRSIQLQVKGYK